MYVLLKKIYTCITQLQTVMRIFVISIHNVVWLQQERIYNSFELFTKTTYQCSLRRRKNLLFGIFVTGRFKVKILQDYISPRVYDY